MPIQILESKKLSEKENLFLRNLRSNLAVDDMYKTMQSYKELRPLDDKNVFFDRVVKANPDVFMEAIDMFTEGVKEVFLERVDRYDWLNERDIKRLKEVAKRLILLGIPPEKAAEATELPLDSVIELANQMQKLPDGV